MDYVYLCWVREQRMQADLEESIMDNLDLLLNEPLAGTWAAEPARPASSVSREAWGRTPEAIESQRRQEML